MGNTTGPTPRAGRIRLLRSLLGGAGMLRLTRFEIAEHSMRPTLDHGDWVLATRRASRVEPGDVVVVDHPDRPGFELVKRVTSIGVDGVVLLGDDPSAGSVDSVTFGPVPEASISARVLLRYRPLPLRLVR